MNHQAVNCDSPVFNSSLISTDEALKFLLDSAVVVDYKEHVSLDDSLGRVLASDIHSSINVPGFDNSAMDGYAIAIKDSQLSKTKHSFNVVDRIPAGKVGGKLKEGCAARIFTGAPIPPGANSVIMQEECGVSEDGALITISRSVQLNENIRPTGNDIAEGDVILCEGKKIQPQDISLAASVGISELIVFKKVVVGVFFTGDELVDPGLPLGPGEIYNSNRYALVSLIKQAGCEVVNLGNVEDKLSATCSALENLEKKCDLIMTTGGVSVGEEDHVRPAVESLGELKLWKIRMKPGKPLAYGRINKTPFIGLPGNPVSSFVTYCIFALPYIKKMQGNEKYKSKSIKVRANFNCNRAKPRREFARARLDYSTGSPVANLYPKQGSDVMSSIVWSDGLIEIPEDTTFEVGETLNFFPINELTG